MIFSLGKNNKIFIIRQLIIIKILYRGTAVRLYRNYDITNCSVLRLLCSTKTCFPFMNSFSMPFL